MVARLISALSPTSAVEGREPLENQGPVDFSGTIRLVSLPGFSWTYDLCRHSKRLAVAPNSRSGAIASIRLSRASLIRLPREEPAGLPLVPGGQGGPRFPTFGVGRGFAIWGPFPVRAPDSAPETCTALNKNLALHPALPVVDGCGGFAGCGGFVFTHGHLGFHKKRAAPVCMILVISGKLAREQEQSKPPKPPKPLTSWCSQLHPAYETG
jgi:hypothetical protein